MSLPKVTVAVVCLNEEKNIVPCIDSLLGQSYDPKNYEILVIDNNSSDKTQKIVRSYQSGGRVRMVVNKKRGIAVSRNVAVREAAYDLLAFTDADCEVPGDWLKKLVSGYLKYKKKDSLVVAVGGGNVPPSNTTFYQAMGIMLNTYLGSRGSVQGRRFSKDRFVKHLPCVNVLYEKKAILKIGGFDESLGSIIEDEDLSYRLWKEKRHFVYLAGVEVIHKMRSNFKSWAKNMFVYGKGRVWFLRRHPEKWSLAFLAPIALILLFPTLGGFYLLATLFYSLWVVNEKEKPNLLLLVWAFFVITHLSYGLGEIWGFFKRS